MPSLTELEAPTDSSQERVAELLVLRQHPATREIIPIGRLTSDEGSYVFCYTRAAQAASGLRPLLGFEDFDREYVSDRLHPIFAQRVMSRDRPDFESYVRSWGLDPTDATPWEQIVQSGGYREGDTLQFMEIPQVRDGVARARFFINGVRHVPDCEIQMLDGTSVVASSEKHERALRGLTIGDAVVAVAELDNKYDQNAMIVLSTDGVPLGWVPQALSSSLRELGGGVGVSLSVARIGEPSGPPHTRVVVELAVPVDSEFRFDRDGRWQPLPDGR